MIILALLDFVSSGAGVRRASVIRPSVRPSITQICQKQLHGCRPNFKESYLYPPYLQTFSFSFFFSKVFTFQIFMIFFALVNMGPYGSKRFKTLLLLLFSSDLSQTLWRNKAVITECKVMDILAICQKLKIKKIVAHWNFNMWINGKILKCAISWKRLIVGLAHVSTTYVGYFLCLILWVQFGVTLWEQKFQNATPPPVFIRS